MDVKFVPANLKFSDLKIGDAFSFKDCEFALKTSEWAFISQSNGNWYVTDTSKSLHWSSVQVCKWIVNDINSPPHYDNIIVSKLIAELHVKNVGF